MLHNEIKELKKRVENLNSKIDELNGGTSFLRLNFIEKTQLGFYSKINKYIEEQKQANDDIKLFAGIKVALNGFDRRSNRVILKGFFSLYEGNDKNQCLNLVRENVEQLEKRYLNFLERGLLLIKKNLK